MSALSDALNEANVDGWSTREIARRGGHRVSHTQLGKYLRANHPQPTDAVLRVFAEVFRIPLPRLRELAGRPAGEAEPYVAPDEANLLDGRQRRALDELIRAMVDPRAMASAQTAADVSSLHERQGRRRGEYGGENLTNKRQDNGHDVRAARRGQPNLVRDDEFSLPDPEGPDDGA